MQRLAGRTAIVTGAARGIGLAIARAFAAEGASVLLADVDPVVETRAAELGQRWHVADVSQVAEIEALFAAADQAFERLDILVNNAGVTHAASLLELTEADYDRVMAVNVKSMVFATQAAARRMVPHRAGAIVNLSSVNAVLAIPNQVPYSISKGAIRQLTTVSAQALAPYGIRVNAIGPGSIATEMMAGIASNEAAMARVMSRTPLGRVGEPSEVAAVAVFLAGDEASYITGQTIYPDGGRLGLNYLAEPRA